MSERESSELKTPPQWGGLTEQIYLVMRTAVEEKNQMKQQLVDQERAWRAEVEKRDKEIKELRGRVKRGNRDLLARMEKEYEKVSSGLNQLGQIILNERERNDRLVLEKKALEAENSHLLDLLGQNINKRKREDGVAKQGGEEIGDVVGGGGQAKG